ncbi:matrixin family metalloprotease [Corallococcus coralloides]|uniref:matrixin family metalloprotease n=1 Tax=Corallococcus coralloides TaxID=184914 RepID=UPI000A0181DC|nr:matrixin family metalloprotease [Corallococcus coralloides]
MRQHSWQAPDADEVRNDFETGPGRRVAAYLERFGYLPNGRRAATTQERDIERALADFQRLAGLEPTGKFDEKTAKAMARPRCGFPDANLEDFAVAATRWPADHQTISYRFDSFSADVTQEQAREVFLRAFGLWSDVTPLRFVEAAEAADIRIRWANGDHGDGSSFDGAGTVLAHAFFPPPNNGELAGDAHFDEDETWSVADPAPAGTFNLLCVAAHEIGHSLGLRHSDVPGALMQPFYGGQTVLGSDDVTGIQSLYGSRLPSWQELDNNPATRAIVADGNNLYQLHNNGRIWRFTGTPLTGWQELDNNPATRAIIADGNNLYQLHDNGRIWKFTGTPFTGWQELDNNPATRAIVADGNNLYQLHNNGKIWKFTGTPFTGWQELDNNPATRAIIADGNNLYQLHSNGRIWRFTGTPLTGWQELDNNPATRSIVADGNNLYQLHDNGRIWRFTGTPFSGWQELDNNPATRSIVAEGSNLYQLHDNGRIWKFTGTPFTGWQELDNNPATRAIVADGNDLYQLHDSGRIWKLL